MTFLESYADRVLLLLWASVVFIPLERLVPRTRHQTLRRADLKLDLAYTFVGVIPIMFASAIFVTGVVAALSNLVPDPARAFVQSQPLWAQVVALMVLGDLYYYWVHRLFHRVPFLWRFHAVHHSIEHMDWIAAHRTHPLDTAITNSGVVILAILLDFQVAAFAIFSTQFAIHSLLKHSNVRTGWGPLRWLYLTPTFHHWHHANSEDAYDKNFAGQFPVWDLLFGTAIMREDHGPEKYGTNDPVPRTFAGSLLYPFRRHAVDAGAGENENASRGTPVFERPGPASTASPGLSHP